MLGQVGKITEITKNFQSKSMIIGHLAVLVGFGSASKLRWRPEKIEHVTGLFMNPDVLGVTYTSPGYSYVTYRIPGHRQDIRLHVLYLFVKPAGTTLFPYSRHRARRKYFSTVCLQ